MTRGNQREKSRAKNLKKQQEEQKKKTAKEKTGCSYAERKQRDADLMREKQQKYESQSAAPKNNEKKKN